MGADRLHDLALYDHRPAAHSGGRGHAVGDRHLDWHEPDVAGYVAHRDTLVLCLAKWQVRNASRLRQVDSHNKFADFARAIMKTRQEIPCQVCGQPRTFHVGMQWCSSCGWN